MTMDREAILQVMARRAGLTESQVDALRRRDYAALLLEEPPGVPDPATVPRGAGPRYPWDDAGVLVQEEQPSQADLQVALERMSRRLALVRHQRDAGLQLLRQVATRLGCCPDCWGTESACPTCGGLGSPGYFAPDAHLVDWLGPALDRATAHADASTPPSALSPGAAEADHGPSAPDDAHGPTRPAPVPVRRPTTAHTDGWA
ncbi:hypothetical protein [Actinotalea sp. Marseille-Q4924]|uniref:hypothetical protein n=1 Tax=Actinotalea sp. Marseille-Q4924 TaxID=2866571 RepID=UPI001CE448CF|nr:hypothetical protein [Actinotalea sp. Marseille-Q4924]